MTVVVFLGPTLPVEEARRELDAIYLPPVSQGDVLRATERRPWAIAIVDGYFERIPAVWHKEILFAMKEGIHVFGSASMGALRAVELETFGMEGVGRIYEDFRSGKLEDDDEVALIHATADDRYRAASEPMVNIRYTFEAARDEGVIAAAAADALIRLAKDRFYPERNYRSILEDAGREDRIPRAELRALEAWLPEGKVDQKRADALAMLRRIEVRRRSPPEPKETRFSFQHTDAWAALYRQSRSPHQEHGGGAEPRSPEAWLEELRLQGEETYGRRREEAWARLLGLEVARPDGDTPVDRAVVADLAETLRRERGLLSSKSFESWIAEIGTTPAELRRWLEDEARLRKLRALRGSRLQDGLRGILLLSGEHQRLLRRALDKERALKDHGLENPGLAAAGLEEVELWRWYFEQLLGREVPGDLDAYAARIDLASAGALRRAVLRELCYRRLEGDSAAEAPSREERAAQKRTASSTP